MSFVLPGHPLHIKCLVLGSAGCGKTSILRRVFYNTFDPLRASTVGSDWYTKRIDNPYYFQLESPTTESTTAISSRQSQRRPSKKQDSERKSRRSLEPILEEDKKDAKKKREKHRQSLTQSIKEEPETTNQTVKPDHHQTSPRRRERKSKVAASSSNGLTYEDIPNEIRMIPQLIVQMWDTAGLEKNVSANKAHGLTANFGDNFFRHSQVAILVYDATSSRSFTQLIQWYSDLLERVHKIHDSSSSSSSIDPYSPVQQHFPVLIVANKLDQLQKERSLQHSKPTVTQRDVIGLHHQFKGNDSRYEYTVSTTASQHSVDKRRRKRGESPTKTLSYSLEGASWTSDHSYLDSIITAEDGSFPGKSVCVSYCMVLLCFFYDAVLFIYCFCIV